MTVTVPTDVKASWAQTINGVSYAADARLEYADIEFLARTNSLSAYLSNGSLYLSPTPNGQDPHRAGRSVPVGLNVKVLNALLTQEQSQDVPAIPTDVVATAATATTVSVAFTAGAAGGASIMNYEYKVGSGAWTALDPADVTTPITVPVAAGASGTLRIRAVNLHGPGVQSATAAYSVALPAAPTALVATPGDTTASIAFTPGAAGGSSITDYEYRVDAGAWTTGATSASPVVITGLTNDVEVSVELRAVSAFGNGAASAAVLVTPTA
jgi:hypothetical protein